MMHKYLAAIAVLYLVINFSSVIYKSNIVAVNSSLTPASRPANAKYDETLDGLVWFVQVSDLHFSIFVDENRPKDFSLFCQFIRHFIKPEAVILTGDLTDAKTSDKLGSRQFEPEWKLYQQTMDICGAYEKDVKPVWLDVRGNHDTFNTHGPANDFYIRFGIEKDKRTYWKKIEANNVTVGLVALDATLMPGPKRPFNFFGSLDLDELTFFENTMKLSEQGSDYQIVFGHYPTSTILSPGHGLKTAIGNASAYLCGHLHTLNGLVKHMYSSQPEGFLEMELGDWKDNRIFRILAIDQGQLTFTDLAFDPNAKEYSYSLITNPMDMTYVQPQDFSLIQQSTHVRALIFSQAKCDKAELVIDHNHKIQLAETSNNLYTGKWNASLFDDGQVHTAQIRLLYLDGSSEEHPTIRFALSPNVELGLTDTLAKIVLGFNWSLVTQAVFGLCAAFIVIPLCLLRTYPRWLTCSRFRLFRGLNDLASTNHFFYPIVIASLYISFGPWAVGFVLDDHVGLLFPWGLFVKGHILPADVTHLYGVFFMYPYMAMLIFAISLRRPKRAFENGAVYWLKANLIFIVVLILQLLHCLEFFLCYGVIASFLGICGVGRLLFVIHLWKKSVSCSEKA